MKKNIFSALLSLCLMMLLGFAVFTGTAHADGPATCSDGQTSCGIVGTWNPPGMISTCTIYGGGIAGGQVCDTNVPGLSYLNANAQNGSWSTQGDVQGVVPATSTESGYNEGFFGSQGQVEFYNVDDDGSVNIINQSGQSTYQYSYSACSCNPNTGNDVAGSGCGGQNQTGLPHFDNITVSPGDKIDLQVINACKPNGTGPWGTGKATITGLDATYCYSSSNPNSPYIDPNNTSLGRRNYMPTASGVCTPNNLPVAPTYAVLGINQISVSIVDKVTAPTTDNVGVQNSGAIPMTWSCYINGQYINGGCSDDFGLKSKPAWLNVALAQETPLAPGGTQAVPFTFDHSEVQAVGSAVQGSVDFSCGVNGGCAPGAPDALDSINYTVPAPTIGSFGLPVGSVPVQSGQAPTLAWTASYYNTSQYASSAACITGGGFGTSGKCYAGNAGPVQDPSPITSPTTYTLKVRGLSDVDNNSDNFATMSVTITPTAPPPVNLICRVTPSASQTQASQGANESFVFGVSGSQTGNYTWYSNGVANGATGAAYAYSSSNPGTSPTISVTSSDGGSANCGTATVVAPAGVPTLSMKITDTTKVPNVSISSPNPPGNFTVGDNWTITVTGSDVSPGAGIYLCLPGSCTEDGSFANVVGGVGTWTFSGSFSVAGGPYTEWANLTGNTTGPQSNDVGFSVTPANTAFSCALTASPSTYITSGNTATIGWSTAASSCTGSGGIGSWSGSKAGSGSFTSALTSNTTFDMSCNNPSTGVSTACTPVTVLVSPPVTQTQSLSCSPASQSVSVSQAINPIYASGGSGNYTWTMMNATEPLVDTQGGSPVGDSYPVSSVGTWPVVVRDNNSGASAQCASVTVISQSSAVDHVSVQCSPMSVLESGTFSCTASVFPSASGSVNNFNNNVNWSQPSEGSLVSTAVGVGVPPSAVFRAPANATGTMVITATSVLDSTKSGIANVPVTAPAPPVPTLKGVSVNCTPSMIYVNGTSTCSASLVFAGNRIPWFADANVGHNFISSAEAAGNPGFLWSTTFGTIDQNGNYTAPATPGTATIFGSTSTLNGLISGSSTITINPAPVPPPQPTNTATLTVSPRSADTATPVTLTATIGGTATGTVNYSFWWNCPGSYASVAAATAACGDPTNPANGAKFNGQPTASQSASTTYPSAGTYTPMVIVERGSAAPAEAQVSVSVANAAPTLSISANPSSVTFSQPVSLMWSSTNVSSCTASSSPAEGDWTGSKPTQSPVGGQTVIPTQVGVTSETYSLTCVGGNGMITKSAVVPVGAPPTVSCSPLMANPTNLVPPEQSTLSWSCSNASACTVNGTAVNPGNGNTVVTPATTTQYLLDCTGLGGWGTATSSVTITVGGTNIHETNP